MVNRAKNPYSRVYSVRRLFSAWQHVFQNGIQSKSEHTREAVKAYSADALRSIQRISRQLSNDSFEFDPAQGIPLRRDKKSPRPIVRSSIKDRIVQRSILDALQEENGIQSFLTVATSFGGLKGRNVSDAIELAYNYITKGKHFYIRSDIEGFFTKIPRERVVSKVKEIVQNHRFIELFQKATTTELMNLADLERKGLKDLFPIYEIGVAQGCCLSPLVGNVLLHDFDLAMNGKGIVCIRYIDDFLILGPSFSKIRMAFISAQKILNQYGLRAYDPQIEKHKAEIGRADKGLDFLGCEIRPGLIRPNKKSQNKLLLSIRKRLQESIQLMGSSKTEEAKKHSFLQTLFDISNTTSGWGNQYSFCNDGQLQSRLDSEIDKLLEFYHRVYLTKCSNFYKASNLSQLRRLLGVHLISDSKKAPIVKIDNGSPPTASTLQKISNAS